jgi:hypothetical protein
MRERSRRRTLPTTSNTKTRTSVSPRRGPIPVGWRWGHCRKDRGTDEPCSGRPVQRSFDTVDRSGLRAATYGRSPTTKWSGEIPSADAVLATSRSLWKQWEQPTVDWLDRWASRIYAELNRAIPIRPHRLGTRQFTIAQPHWETYLRGDQPNPKMALRAAMKAVRAVAD